MTLRHALTSAPCNVSAIVYTLQTTYLRACRFVPISSTSAYRRPQHERPYEVVVFGTFTPVLLLWLSEMEAAADVPGTHAPVLLLSFSETEAVADGAFLRATLRQSHLLPILYALERYRVIDVMVALVPGGTRLERGWTSARTVSLVRLRTLLPAHLAAGRRTRSSPSVQRFPDSKPDDAGVVVGDPGGGGTGLAHSAPAEPRPFRISTMASPGLRPTLSCG
ncbi:hypothetical protein GGX14DRAFT_559883 [Mycena pura]|uniref:Uncharacterized protein n=1 Tax=Mycena pura TaxID=153505 RepID=A0AAD6YIN4_9AGAR|nr:hypothetical protein GGX14DRAFT_559883 [Mycena pura]